jgi:hypothetical protein
MAVLSGAFTAAMGPPVVLTGEGSSVAFRAVAVSVVMVVSGARAARPREFVELAGFGKAFHQAQ